VFAESVEPLPSLTDTHMMQTILSPYKNDRFIQVAAVQFHTRKHQSHHQLPQNKDYTKTLKTC